MLTFLYLTFTCGHDELQDRLTAAGADGWRLHTCTPGVAVYDGSSPTCILVVLDKAIAPEEAAYEPEAAPEGLEMKG